MKLEIFLIDEIWARIRFIDESDCLLGVLAPSRNSGLPKIIKVAQLAGWTINNEKSSLAPDDIGKIVEQLYDIIERDFPNNYKPITAGSYGYVVRAVMEAIQNA